MPKKSESSVSAKSLKPLDSAEILTPVLADSHAESSEGQNPEAMGDGMNEDADDLAGFEESSGDASGSGEAAAAVTAGTETSLSFKNFRHHPEMENFYRFIYENDLRFEALSIIDTILGEKKMSKKVKAAKAQPH